jgi:protein-tyrosine phosphatase
MTQIWQRLWVGGLTDAERLAKGNPNGITSVISLSELPVENERRGVNYIRLPIEDDEEVPLHQFDAIIDALSENIRWGTVLLNCGVGISRAPSLAAAYMDACGYRDIDAALDEIRMVRPFISPSNILVNSLKEHLR